MNLYEMDFVNAELALRDMTREELVQQAMNMRSGVKLTERAMQGLCSLVMDCVQSAMSTSNEDDRERYLRAALAALKPVAEGEDK